MIRGIFVFASIFALAASDFVLHDGDMLLTPAQKKLYGAGSGNNAGFAGAGVKKDDIWPKGVIA